MQKRRCGNSDLEISVLGAGCWAFGGGEYWGEQNQKDVNMVVRRAVESGINYFDTAEAYNEGRSEESLGKALKDIPRDSVLIGTKISPSNAAPETLIEHCQASLKRLKTDYIDLYLLHWPIHPHSIRHFTDDESIISSPPSTEEAFTALAKLKKQGKIRYIGVSNFGLQRLKQAQAFDAEIIINELPYSLLTRAIEAEILPYCRKTGVGIIGYMTLLQGLLADAYFSLKDVPAWQRRTRHFHHENCPLSRHGEEGAEEETDRALADIRAIAKECGMSMPEMAVKWAVSSKAVTCALVGARNVEELEANVKAVQEPLADEIVQRLDAATRPLMQKLGPSADYYESTANCRM